MPGLDIEIMMHKIPVKPEFPLVLQALWRMKSEIILKIKEEVEKQLKASFLTTIAYLDWVANIVLVPKKDGKVHMCVDYRDLNGASPKDNFSLPHIDTLIVRLNLFNHVLALFHAKFACNLAIRYLVFRWELCKGSVWESVKKV